MRLRDYIAELIEAGHTDVEILEIARSGYGKPVKPSRIRDTLAILRGPEFNPEAMKVSIRRAVPSHSSSITMQAPVTLARVKWLERAEID